MSSNIRVICVNQRQTNFSPQFRWRIASSGCPSPSSTSSQIWSLPLFSTNCSKKLDLLFNYFFCSCKTILLLSSVFMKNWNWLQSPNIFGTDPETIITVYCVVHLVGLTSTCTNPVLYAFFNENLRREFDGILECFLPGFRCVKFISTFIKQLLQKARTFYQLKWSSLFETVVIEMVKLASDRRKDRGWVDPTDGGEDGVA